MAVGAVGRVMVVFPCNPDVLYNPLELFPFIASKETFMGDDALIPVIDIAGVEVKDEDDNFRFVLILLLGVTLVIVEDPACCIVKPRDGVFCWIGVTDIP